MPFPRDVTVLKKEAKRKKGKWKGRRLSNRFKAFDFLHTFTHSGTKQAVSENQFTASFYSFDIKRG